MKSKKYHTFAVLTENNCWYELLESDIEIKRNEGEEAYKRHKDFLEQEWLNFFYKTLEEASPDDLLTVVDYKG